MKESIGTSADGGTRGRQWSLAVTSLAAALMGGVSAFIRLADQDTWWHLATGRLLLRGHFPITNTFSHTYPQHPWKNPQWLHQVVVAVAERIGDLDAVTIVPAMFIALVSVITISSARRSGKTFSPPVALGLLALTLSASRFRFVPRPELFTFLGVATVVHLWVRRPRGILPLMALIGCCWANAHPGILFGLLLLFTLTLVEGWLDHTRPRGWRALLPVTAFLGGSLFTPYGAYPYFYALVHAKAKEIVPVAEYSPPQWPLDATFFFMTGLIVLCSVRAWRGGSRRLAFLTILLGLPTLTYVRLIPVFLFAVLPFTIAEVSSAVDRYMPRRRGAARVAALVFLAAVTFLIARDFRLNSTVTVFGLGVSKDWVPEGAASFVRKHCLSGNMYNDYDHGGYFAWSLFPDHRIFVDGRMPAYPRSFYDELASLRTSEEWSALLDRYRITYALVERFPYGGDNLGKMFEAYGWPLVYMDGVSLIYLRRGSDDASRLDHLRFLSLRSEDDPNTLYAKASKEPEALLHDLRLVVIDRLIAPWDFIRLGGAAALAGDGTLGGEIVSRGLAKHPGNPDLVHLRDELAMLLPRR